MWLVLKITTLKFFPNVQLVPHGLMSASGSIRLRCCIYFLPPYLETLFPVSRTSYHVNSQHVVITVHICIQLSFKNMTGIFNKLYISYVLLFMLCHSDVLRFSVAAQGKRLDSSSLANSGSIIVNWQLLVTANWLLY